MKPNRLLLWNAAFLLFMGGAAAIADAAGHFLGKGPSPSVSCSGWGPEGRRHAAGTSSAR